MKFSSQEEYGLRCLIQIARRENGASLTIPEISRLEGITPTHTAKLLMILRKDGFVVSTRGQSGGYTLARPAKDINVGEVLSCLGGKLYDSEFCRKHSGSLEICTHGGDCSVRSLWQVVQESVDSILSRVSLADMLTDPTSRQSIQLFETPRRAVAVK